MRRFSVPVGPLTFLGVLGLLLAPAAAADLGSAQPPRGGFRATCEDLGTFCFAETCGGDQIDAAQNCRARCPSAAILSVVPAACRRPGPVVLRSRG
ncbi:hypothetical protein ACLBX9_14060 [Methylobacterium sp. A49B]